ncbi:MAG: bifunctional metallophosphatase/5'-nucleotidase [Armatimonadetes bacterium]|nr:bifunctional metallophosphatase/5'-nucleotidase [Armatimonadota bacterium]
MLKIKFKFILLFIFLLFSSPWAENIHLVILHTNDFHGRLLPYKDSSGEEIAGAENLSGLIRDMRKKYPEVLLLDAGDIAQGTPISNLFFGKPVVEVMNYNKYFASTLGNHEFDWGQDKLKEIIHQANFPFICANIFDEKTGKRFANLKPYLIFKLKNIKIGIIGLITPQTFQTTMPSHVKNLIFEDPLKIYAGIYPLLKSKGVDLIIVLSHLGLEDDMRLAENSSGIDLIVGGHSHTVLNSPKKINQTYIVQAGSYGKYLGKVDLEINSQDKKIIEIKGELIPLNKQNYNPQKDVSKIIEKYYTKIKEKMGEIVGETRINLIKENSLGDFPLANLITNAMKEETGAQIAFQNTGGIRASLYKGKITWGDLYNVLPFGNSIVKMNLKGGQILKIIEIALNNENQGMQFSGINLIYDNKNKRIIRIKVGEEPLETQKSYTIAANNFLAEGGDGYLSFLEGENLSYGKDLLEIVINYLKLHSPIEDIETGRVKLIIKERGYFDIFKNCKAAA